MVLSCQPFPGSVCIKTEIQPSNPPGDPPSIRDVFKPLKKRACWWVISPETGQDHL